MNLIPKRLFRTSASQRNTLMLKKLNNPSTTTTKNYFKNISLLIFYNSHRPILIPSKKPAHAAKPIESEYRYLFRDRDYAMDLIATDHWIQEDTTNDLVDLNSDIYYCKSKKIYVFFKLFN